MIAQASLASASLRAGLTGGILVLGLAACGNSASSQTAQPTVSVLTEHSDAPMVVPGLASPAVTLSAPAAPTGFGPGVATAAPAVVPQWLPPDVGQSGIALFVSSTTYTPGQRIELSAQAAPELAGHTSYLVTDGGVTLANGTVDQAGRFTLSFTPGPTTRLWAAVAGAGVPAGAAYNAEDIVARSAEVTVTAQ